MGCNRWISLVVLKKKKKGFWCFFNWNVYNPPGLAWLLDCRSQMKVKSQNIAESSHVMELHGAIVLAGLPTSPPLSTQTSCQFYRISFINTYCPYQ